MLCCAVSSGAAVTISDTVLNGHDRPRVGLVLSGGGAKGAAHAGVIKALEENDIAIDCVAGTSMGAIVGSLYACGWSPQEMIDFFTSKDFSYWSTGTLNPADIYYFSQPDPTPKWVELNLAIRDTTNRINAALPSNLISPLPMNIEFLKLYSPYSRQCGEDFNNLFVPLRTVCSDIYHKHKVVCRNGSLGDAVRASMSFPLVFKPIEMDGVLMYDGGIYDNFPVDVMQQDFNPDFIIGVSVSAPDGKPVPDNAYSQLEDMIIQNNDYSLPAKAGVKIQVPVLKFGVLDFDKCQEIFDIGYKTGLQMVDSIKKRCPQKRPHAEVQARRKAFRDATPQVFFDSVRVTGASRQQSEFLENLFYNGRHHRVPISMERVEDAYYRAVTDRKLRDLLPQYEPHSDGTSTLLLKATPRNPWNVGIGGYMSSSVHSMLYLNFGYNTLRYNSLDVVLSGWIGQSYCAARLVGKFYITGKIPSFIEASFSISRQKEYNKEVLFFQTNTPSFVTESEGFFRIGYCRAAGKRGKLFARFSAGRLSYRFYPIGKEDYVGVQKDRSTYRALNLTFGYDYSTLDDYMYPMDGKYLDVRLEGENDDVRYYNRNDKESMRKLGSHWSASLHANGKYFIPLHQNFRLGISGYVTLSLHDLYQSYTATLVNSESFGPTPTTRNYFNSAFRSDNYLAAGLSPVWNPFGKFQIRGDFFAYSPVRELSPLTDGSCRYSGWFRRAEFLGEVAAVYNFPFASLSLYANYLTSPARNWNFGISFGLYFQAPKFR